MKCPRCQSEKIEPFKHEGVEFDFCTDCTGIWCDRGELAQYVETIKDTPESFHLTSEGKHTEMTCPKCNSQTLYELPYLRDQDLLIDKCSECYGIWLDSKELGQVQKLSTSVDAKGKLERTIRQMQEDGYSVTVK
jgi:Zn-finger nucleic acid-binding protein